MRTEVLKFPDEAVGELLDERFPKWPKIAEARGDVAILGRPKLVLSLAEPPSRQLPFLLALPTDSLYGIRLAFMPVCEADLPYLLELKRLRLIDLSGSGIRDDVFLGLVTNLPHLRAINFGGTLVSDFALRDMPRLHAVRVLETGGRRVPIGDRGAVSVGIKMPRLVTLDLSVTDIGDEGVRGITHLPLRSLSVHGDRITDAGLASLAGMNSLRKLNLSDTKISDASLYFLRTMSRLSLLMLIRTAVTDEGLSHLLNLPRLEVLYLMSTKITDKAADWLARMTQLRLLGLGEQLSRDSVERLRKALPDCRISAIDSELRPI